MTCAIWRSVLWSTKNGTKLLLCSCKLRTNYSRTYSVNQVTDSYSIGRYHSVRIDAVHYCEREQDLAVKRKRRSFFERGSNPKDAPQQRLALFSRTVREDSFLASQVQYLKMSYMTRESAKSDLARSVSVLPNLRYVDLPEGFYSDDPSSNTLKQELQARCPDIRSMKYQAGAERSFATLAQSRYWQSLETLELSRLHIEPTILIQVLSLFTFLHHVKLSNLPLLDDSIFKHLPSAPRFPPVASLSIEDAPNISVDGFVAYLSRPDTSEIFATLSLANTAISPASLHKILAVSPYLGSVHISENVTRALLTSPLPPLASRSLKSLHFEISSPSASPHSLQNPAESYYNYLSTSIMSGSLPSLTSLYALSPTLPSLLLPLPSAPFANISNGRPSYPGIKRPLHLYTKTILELEWNLTLISPPTAKDRRGSVSATRPVSLYNSEQFSQTSGNRGRDSIMVGNGFGGFLEVPNEEARPGSSNGVRNRIRRGDAWMG